jgi:hypothetical protein
MSIYTCPIKSVIYVAISIQFYATRSFFYRIAILSLTLLIIVNSITNKQKKTTYIKIKLWIVICSIQSMSKIKIKLRIVPVIRILMMTIESGRAHSIASDESCEILSFGLASF